MTFSLKSQLSPNSALRLGFRGSYEKTENDTNTAINVINNSFGVNLVYMYYLNPKKEFNIYGYAGGTYTYRGYSRHTEFSDDNNYQWETGILLGAGAEFFVFEQMSLFAEYSYKFLFGKNGPSTYVTIFILSFFLPRATYVFVMQKAGISRLTGYLKDTSINGLIFV